MAKKYRNERKKQKQLKNVLRPVAGSKKRTAWTVTKLFTVTLLTAEPLTFYISSLLNGYLRSAPYVQYCACFGSSHKSIDASSGLPSRRLYAREISYTWPSCKLEMLL